MFSLQKSNVSEGIEMLLSFHELIMHNAYFYQNIMPYAINKYKFYLSILIYKYMCTASSKNK
jgi:hypothetical protein